MNVALAEKSGVPFTLATRVYIPGAIGSLFTTSGTVTVCFHVAPASKLQDANGANGADVPSP